ncbi:uncharacterized protein [Manis javanica]|uniref:uncharacterized protein n=1 Tax=Manis javanica TaxID=9974 RepID=UPI003C6CE6D4
MQEWGGRLEPLGVRADTCAGDLRGRPAPEAVGGAEAALLPILSRSPCREPQLCAGGGTGERPPLGPPLAAPPPPPPGLDVRPPYPPRRPEARVGSGAGARGPDVTARRRASRRASRPGSQHERPRSARRRGHRPSWRPQALLSRRPACLCRLLRWPGRSPSPPSAALPLSLKSQKRLIGREEWTEAKEPSSFSTRATPVYSLQVRHSTNTSAPAACQALGCRDE